MLKVSGGPCRWSSLSGKKRTTNSSFIENEGPSPTQAAFDNLLKEKIEQVLSTLTPREQRILRLRFGLVNGKCYTLEEVGQKFGLTRERIRRLKPAPYVVCATLGTAG